MAAWARMMKAPPRGRSEGVTGETKRRPGLADYLALARIRSYVLNTAAMAAMTFAIGGIGYWMPRYLVNIRGVPEARANTTFGGILVVAGLIATLAGGWIGDKLRQRFGGAYFL